MTSIATTRSRTYQTGILAVIRDHLKLFTLLGLIVVWVAVWSVTKGQDTLAIAQATITDVHAWFRTQANSIEDGATAGSNVFFVIANSIGDALNWVVTSLQKLFTIPAFPRPLPQVGWLGIIALASWVTFALAGWRSLLLVIPAFMSFGILGVWEDSIDLLIVTGVSVVICLLIGIPIGIAMAHSKRLSAVLDPVLDVMQTMPSFSYLLPVVILFGIGSSAAIVSIFIYAVPPVIRITAHGIRGVSKSTIEATTSLGQTSLQRLRNVELPMAKRTIIVGVNQTMMAALAMAVIAGYIDSPGLGGNVLSALQRNQFGNGVTAGLAIVIMAIMLDRTTTAASERSERVLRSGSSNLTARRIALAVGAVATLVAVYLSHVRSNFNVFPTGIDAGTWLADQVDRFADWLRTDLSSFTSSIQVNFTDYFLNPLQDVIANSPWYLTGFMIVAVSFVVGGWKAFATSLVCLAGVYFLDLWYDTMVTLTSVVVATVVVMVVGVVVGVWMGRSRMADRVIRPILDAAQTIPAFVYLIPILILFGPNRFSAIIAGLVYAVPPASKLIADGIRGVDATTIEAAESAGTSRLQMITKVQIPMSRSSLVLATNQGLLYVLSMVVIGGMVGAGGLGGDIVTGFRQTSFVGRGLAAAICVVLLGIMLDRITRYGAEKTGDQWTFGKTRNTTGTLGQIA